MKLVLPCALLLAWTDLPASWSFPIRLAHSRGFYKASHTGNHISVSDARSLLFSLADKEDTAPDTSDDDDPDKERWIQNGLDELLSAESGDSLSERLQQYLHQLNKGTSSSSYSPKSPGPISDDLNGWEHSVEDLKNLERSLAENADAPLLPKDEPSPSTLDEVSNRLKSYLEQIKREASKTEEQQSESLTEEPSSSSQEVVQEEDPVTELIVDSHPIDGNIIDAESTPSVVIENNADNKDSTDVTSSELAFEISDGLLASANPDDASSTTPTWLADRSIEVVGNTPFDDHFRIEDPHQNRAKRNAPLHKGGSRLFTPNENFCGSDTTADLYNSPTDPFNVYIDVNPEASQVSKTREPTSKKPESSKPTKIDPSLNPVGNTKKPGVSPPQQQQKPPSRTVGQESTIRGEHQPPFTSRTVGQEPTITGKQQPPPTPPRNNVGQDAGNTQFFPQEHEMRSQQQPPPRRPKVNKPPPKVNKPPAASNKNVGPTGFPRRTPAQPSQPLPKVNKPPPKVSKPPTARNQNVGPTVFPRRTPVQPPQSPPQTPPKPPANFKGFQDREPKVPSWQKDPAASRNQQPPPTNNRQPPTPHVNPSIHNGWTKINPPPPATPSWQSPPVDPTVQPPPPGRPQHPPPPVSHVQPPPPQYGRSHGNRVQAPPTGGPHGNQMQTPIGGPHGNHMQPPVGGPHGNHMQPPPGAPHGNHMQPPIGGPQRPPMNQHVPPPLRSQQSRPPVNHVHPPPGRQQSPPPVNPVQPPPQGNTQSPFIVNNNPAPRPGANNRGRQNPGEDLDGSLPLHHGGSRLFGTYQSSQVSHLDNGFEPTISGPSMHRYRAQNPNPPSFAMYDELIRRGSMTFEEAMLAYNRANNNNNNPWGQKGPNGSDMQKGGSRLFRDQSGNVSFD